MLSTCALNLEKQRDEFIRLNGWEEWDIEHVSSSSKGFHEFVSQRKAELGPVLKTRSSEGEWFLEHTDTLPRLVLLVKDTPRLLEMDANDTDDQDTVRGLTNLCHQMEIAIEYTELCEQVIGHIDDEIGHCVSTVFEIQERRLDCSLPTHITASHLDHMARETYPWLSPDDKSVRELFCTLENTKIKPLHMSLSFLPDRVTQFSARCAPVFPSFSTLVHMHWTNLEQQWQKLQGEFASLKEELSTKKWQHILQLALEQLGDDHDTALLSVVQRISSDKNLMVEETRVLSSKRLSTNSSIFSECSDSTELSEHGALSPRMAAPLFPVKRRLHMRVVSLDRFSPKAVIKRHSISDSHVLQDLGSSRLNRQLAVDHEEKFDREDTPNTSSDWSNTSSSSVIVSTPDSDALESSRPVEDVTPVKYDAIRTEPSSESHRAPQHDMSVIMESLESLELSESSPEPPTVTPEPVVETQDPSIVTPEPIEQTANVESLPSPDHHKCHCHTPSIASKFRLLNSKSFIPITNSPNRLLRRYPQLGKDTSDSSDTSAFSDTTPDSANSSFGSMASLGSFGSALGSASVRLGDTPSLAPRQSLIPLPSPQRPASRSSSRLGMSTPLATPTRKPRLSYSNTGGISGMRSVSDTPMSEYRRSESCSSRRSESRSSSRRNSLIPSPVKRLSSTPTAMLPPSTPSVSSEGYSRRVSDSYHSGRVSREGIRGVSSRDGMSLANAGVRIVKPIKR